MKFTLALVATVAARHHHHHRSELVSEEAAHVFNLLDARHAISVTERQRYILRVRTLARQVALEYYEVRKALGFPLASSELKQQLLQDEGKSS